MHFGSPAGLVVGRPSIVLACQICSARTSIRWQAIQHTGGKAPVVLTTSTGTPTTNAAATATAPYGCPLGCSGCKAQTGTADANIPSSNFLLMQLSKLGEDKPQDEPAPGSYVNSSSSRYTYMMQKHDFVNSWLDIDVKPSVVIKTAWERLCWESIFPCVEYSIVL